MAGIVIHYLLRPVEIRSCSYCRKQITRKKVCAADNLTVGCGVMQSAVATAQANKGVFVWNISQSLVSIVTIIKNTFSFRNNICLMTDLESQICLSK